MLYGFSNTGFMRQGPGAAFDARKAMFDAVQQAQCEEHGLLAQIRAVTLDSERELLETLSRWLLGQNHGTVDANAESLASSAGVSLLAWGELQAEAERLEQALATARDEEKRAAKIVGEVAPFGFVSRLMADATTKQEIERRASERREKAIARETLEAKLSTNTERRREIGDTFLRGCLSDFGAVCESKAVGDEARAILVRMAQQIDALWTAHANSQRHRVEELAHHLDVLRECYQ